MTNRERCKTCDRPIASKEDWDTYGEGEGEHLCWGDPMVCTNRAVDWRARCLAAEEAAADPDLLTAYLCGAAGIGGKWTRTPPTEPGWYWACAFKGCSPEVIQVWRATADELAISRTGDSYEPNLSGARNYIWWTTPIPMPPLPEGE